MIDLRPVGYVIGLMVLALGGFMIVPGILDAIASNPDWRAFGVSAVFTLLVGGALTLGCSTGRSAALTIEQAFLLTVLAWVALPVFGALPFMLGEPNSRAVDALFEAVSGITTTGSTIYIGLDDMPPGILLWRALLQWIGGIGIVVFAMVFLPTLQVGGMQLFKSESFDTFGKILPRATEIASSIFSIYLGLTLACALIYASFGMSAFDALCHAMTTIATGGFANYDSSFAGYGPAIQYASVIFMLLASLPFVRYVQLVNGAHQPLLKDAQIRAFLITAFVIMLALTIYRLQTVEGDVERHVRESLFNGVSILTGTGYASADYGLWGAFPVAVFFMIGLIGGCAGSTSCSVKIFRYQILAATVSAELFRVRRPHGVFRPRYEGRPIRPDVISSVLTFFFVFVATLALMTILLTWIGLDSITALSGAATALANVGPGLGPEIGPAGNFAGLPDEAKYVLIVGMLLGRLELLSVLVLLTPSFWRR
ncbi:MAG: TrkH family potassium uptake protein [Pseudomonadota bacterium]